MRIKLWPFLSVAVVAASAACEKSKSSEPEAKETDETTKTGEVAIETNPLAESYPDGLTVTAFSTSDDATTASTTSAGTVAIDYTDAGLWLALQEPPQPPPEGTEPTQSQPAGDGQCTKAAALMLQDTPPVPSCVNSYAEALEQREKMTPPKPPAPPPARLAAAAAKDRINGKSDACYSDEFVSSLSTMREAMQETGKNLDGYGDCFLPDWGIVEGFYPDSEDVCMVGYARAQLSKLSAYVEFTKGLSEAMLCQALKDGTVKVADKEIPEGTTLDLTAQLTKALAPVGPAAPPVTSAKITRSAGGRRFLTEIVVATRARFDSKDTEVPVNIAIDHKPTDATNANYSGLVRIHYKGRGRESEGTIALSLDYSRAADSLGNRVKYELRSGFFGGSASPYDADGILDFNVHGEDACQDELNSINYVSYDGYPELDVAKLSYWVNFGPSYNEAARGMVFDLKRVDGKVKGCAVGGAASIDLEGGISIRRSLAEGYALQPVGYLRPFLCSEDERGGAKMWLQCFTRNDAGAFVPDADLIEDVETGFDFVASSVVEEKVPSLADVPRPPRFTAAKFQPLPGAPVRPAGTRPTAGTPTQPVPLPPAPTGPTSQPAGGTQTAPVPPPAPTGTTQPPPPPP